MQLARDIKQKAKLREQQWLDVSSPGREDQSHYAKQRATDVEPKIKGIGK